jgi:hypothetical protein
MARTLLTVVLVFSVLLAASYWFYRTKLAVTQIDYLGETFKLPRAYPTYEAYRNDPNNLGPVNLARIQQLVQTSALAETFADTESFGRAAGVLKVPGYGMAGIKVEAPEPKPVLVAVEIPGTSKWRYLLGAGGVGSVRAADDFVYEGPRITEVVVHEGVARYFTPHGLLRERTL